MAKKTLEATSYSKVIFWITAVLILSTGWAVYDEVEVRRPWKKYQRLFLAAQVSRLDSMIHDAERAIEEPSGRQERAEILQELERSRAALGSPEIKKVLVQIDEAENILRETRQSRTFKKSEYDEAYYFYKLNQHSGGDAARHKARMDTLQAEIAALDREISGRARGIAKRRSVVSEYVDTIAALEKRLEATSRTVDILRDQRENFASRALRVKQIVVDDLGTVDRCGTCHVAIDKKGFEGAQHEQPLRTHPELSVLLGKAHPVERFGCTVCHEGQGAQIKGIGHRPFDHGRNDPYWDRPMLAHPFTQSNCRKCHEKEWEIASAPILNQGRRLFEELGCFGCHPIDGLPTLRKVGPDLTRLRGKIDPGWLVRWIRNPRALRPRTLMPNFWPQAVGAGSHPGTGSSASMDRNDEVQAIAAYLWVNSSADLPEPVGRISADAGRGAALFQSVGCLGCHRPAVLRVAPLSTRSVDRDFAPDLSDIGSKTSYAWLYSWIRNPKRHWKDTKMPSLRLDEQEAADIAGYLATLTRHEVFPAPRVFESKDEAQLRRLSEKGKELISAYACWGCHNIRGFETVRPALPLDGFGSKSPVRLAFGDAITNPHQQTWYGWTRLKLKHPREFETERIRLRMPDYTLTDSEIDALMVFLKSLTPEIMPSRYVRRLDARERDLVEGERLVNYYNCRGCHRIGGRGGDISSVISETALNPPDLTGEGAKVRAAWLFQYLKNPSPLRPWLTLRMPSFGFDNGEASAIIAYLAAMVDERDLFVEAPPRPPDALIVAGAEMFDRFKCIQCHQLTSNQQVSVSDLAPDLALARSRLRPDWIERWLIDPQALQPETRMPTFFPLEDDDDPESITTPLPDILGGDVKKQVRAIRDHLIFLGDE